MCGIAGIIQFNDHIDQHYLKAMTDAIKHRGPDGEGHFYNQNKTVGLGHRRLSIIDLSPDGAQPMKLHDNPRYTITFNGEIYNYLELRRDLQMQGFVFQTETDTEVLLRLFALKNTKCLAQIDGMFAFAIWDEQEQKLYCARDRFGEKPFYYYSDKQKFVFASEIKALAAGGIAKQVHRQSLFEYLHRGKVSFPEGRTFFQDISYLEPAHWLILNTLEGSMHQYPFWKLEPERGNYANINAIDHFSSLFEQSVNRRLRADVAVGSSLSGGLDSSAIVATIDELKRGGQIQKTFSARFPGYSKDEGHYIDLMNQAVSLQGYSVVPNAHEMMADFDLLLHHHEEPFQHSSIYAQWKVMELAKKNDVTVLLDGQGADEFLGGYHAFLHVYLKQLFLKNKREYRRLKENINDLLGKDFGFSINQKVAYQFPVLANLKQRFLPVTIPSSLHPDFVMENREKVVNRPVPCTLKEALSLSLTENSLPALLRYADRNSMAHSREVRLPYLNHELVMFTLGLADQWLINEKGWTKYVLRKSIEKKLPHEIVWRKDKTGYEPPQKSWLNEPHWQERIKDAELALKKEHILEKVDGQQSWRYLMASALINSSE